MTRLPLARRSSQDDATVVLEATLPPSDAPVALGYRTRTGAIASVDGVIVGAYDREHDAIIVEPSDRERSLTLCVEERALPTNALPSRGDIRWWWLNARAHEPPQPYVSVGGALPVVPAPRADAAPIALWGHSHLDVAWLWTYDEARRKAVRTFANALALLDYDSSFVFMQSQPQLYAFVDEYDPALFERVREYARAGRFDPDVAAMWVEPDCNIPSGESLLRQLLMAHAYCVENFGVEPAIAWLPDSFGFARTLPTLLAHAGIGYFATTKLQWNDTTRFEYPQFRWRGPDGSEVISALIASYDGGFTPQRIATARERREPIVAGYGDGGGGPTMRELQEAGAIGTWERPAQWFQRLRAQASSLPVHDDELYLEYHRGVYTTHHDVKAGNAELERLLAQAEERVAWCIAVRAPHEMIARLRAQVQHAWTIVLRNQFHDVLPGTSIAAVYDDVARDYAEAKALVDGIIAATKTALPRTAREPSQKSVAAQFDGEAYVFDNGFVHARVLRSGAIAELRTKDGRNVVAQGNLLALYRDRPAKWEAWNIDAGYERSRRAAKPQGGELVDGALEVGFKLGKASLASMRVALHANEPFLRVELAVDWRESRTLLRLENWLVIQSANATYGAPHGTVSRSTGAQTPSERARFEVPGQRYAYVQEEAGAGLVLLARDTYGWNARALAKGGLNLGHSLLRSTTWPDPHADRGTHEFAFGFAPTDAASIGAIESAWEQFAGEAYVRLFRSADSAVLIVACKPAQDGNGVIVRVRECDGAQRPVRLRCGGRMRSVEAVDGLERSLSEPVAIVEEELVATIPAYGLRSYRVGF